MKGSVAGRLLVAAAICLFAVAACDKGSSVSVKNESDRTFVAHVGDEAFLIVPPKQHVTVAVQSFTGPRMPEVQLFDADCVPVGKPSSTGGGTFTITGSGKVSFSVEISGSSEVTAETSSFCADAVSGPSPVPSDPGPS